MMAAKVSPAATKKRMKAEPGDSASRIEAILLHLGKTLTCKTMKASVSEDYQEALLLFSRRYLVVDQKSTARS